MSDFVDARTDAVPEEITASVCIVGAGAAGLFLARSLGEEISDVVLVEAGDFRLDGATQNLYAGRQLGLPYFNLISCRLRYFGGTTNHWSGYCRANDPVDYEGRPDLNLPRWPVDGTALAPYLDTAAQALGLATEEFDPAVALRQRGLDAGELAEQHSDILQTKTFLFAPNLRMGEIYRAPLAENDNVRGVLNLNLTRIQLTDTGREVSHLVCQTLEGKQVIVRARKYALCCHAIENARQLLMSDDVQRNGIGNDSDHVGRYFMEHPHIHASRFVPSQAFPLLYNRNYAGRQNFNANLSFTDAYTREAGLLQYYCRFNPVWYAPDTAAAIEGLRSGAMAPGDLDFLRDVATVTGDLDAVGRGVMRRLGLRKNLPDYFEMEHRLEQAPNPDSRVILSDRRDALGSPIADLDWRLLDIDIDSFRRGQEAVGRELSALGWGRMIEEEITRALVEERVEGHYHHIGTTRMSESAADGVVDENCKVFGLSNLYVGGSSIFPTAGYSGPTMMIVAFALRLAEHLKKELA